MTWKRIHNKTFIVAEIGKNHLNNMHLAKLLIDRAVEAGCDAVKFQTHIADDEQLPKKIVSPHFSKSRYLWLKQNTLPIEFFRELQKYCQKKGIIFFSTPMSLEAAKMLHELNVPIYKVGSADLTDFLMLDYIAKTKKPIIISTGMSNLREVDKAIDFLKRRTKKIIIMHCVSMYPCLPSQLNLKSILFLKKRYNLTVGFSDHSLEIYPAMASIILGAKVIEKHFTLDRQLYGPDHKASLLPSEMKELVRGVRMLEDCLGSEHKLLQKKEYKFRPIFRKGLVTKYDLPKNTVLTITNLAAKRPLIYSGIEAHLLEKVVGKRITVKYKKNQPIKFNQLKK